MTSLVKNSYNLLLSSSELIKMDMCTKIVFFLMGLRVGKTNCYKFLTHATIREYRCVWILLWSCLFQLIFTFIALLLLIAAVVIVLILLITLFFHLISNSVTTRGRSEATEGLLLDN